MHVVPDFTQTWLLPDNLHSLPDATAAHPNRSAAARIRRDSRSEREPHAPTERLRPKPVGPDATGSAAQQLPQPRAVGIRRGRGERIRGGVVGERDRMPHPRHPISVGARLHDGLEPESIGPCERLADVEDRRARHAGLR